MGLFCIQKPIVQGPDMRRIRRHDYRLEHLTLDSRPYLVPHMYLVSVCSCYITEGVYKHCLALYFGTCIFFFIDTFCIGTFKLFKQRPLLLFLFMYLCLWLLCDLGQLILKPHFLYCIIAVHGLFYSASIAIDNLL